MTRLFKCIIIEGLKNRRKDDNGSGWREQDVRGGRKVRGRGPNKIFREYLGDITEITSAEDVDQETGSYIEGDAER